LAQCNVTRLAAKRRPLPVAGFQEKVKLGRHFAPPLAETLDVSAAEVALERGLAVGIVLQCTKDFLFPAFLIQICESRYRRPY